MTTLTEIQSAANALSPEQKRMLFRFLEGQLQEVAESPPPRLSVLDIKPVSLGAVLQPFLDTDDLLDEMLGARG